MKKLFKYALLLTTIVIILTACDIAGPLSSEKPDTTDPVITSGDTGRNLAENVGPNAIVYKATADEAVTFSFGTGGDEELLTLEVLTLTEVNVRLNIDPDYETQLTYSFTIIASDAAGNSSSKTVTFSIVDVDEEIPIITSGSVGINLVEGSGANQTVYEAIATDNVGIKEYNIGGTHTLELSVTAKGVVTYKPNPVFDTTDANNNIYKFTIVAVDTVGNISEITTVTFSITQF